MERLNNSKVSVQPIGNYILACVNFKISRMAVNGGKVPLGDLRIMKVVGTGGRIKEVRVGDNIIIGNQYVKDMLSAAIDVPENDRSIEKARKAMAEDDKVKTYGTEYMAEKVSIREYFMIEEYLICAILK